MANKNRNLFRITRLVLLKLPHLLRFFSSFRKADKRILIIKIDAIGDYILFRNYLKEIRKVPKYQGYKVDLLGNNLWKELALTYDSRFIDDFIFITPSPLYEQPRKTFGLGWKLFKKNYEIVLQPAYSRFLLSDGLAALTAAKEIIGFESDNELIFEKYKKKTDRFYIKRLPLPPEYNFEFEKNRFFFQSVTNSVIALPKPILPVDGVQKGKYVIIFPGSGVVSRNWKLENFVALSQLIITNTNFSIMLAGAKSEISYADPFIDLLPANRLINRIGTTDLPEVVQLIAAAQYVICNESSALHIAVACNVPTVCILGGGHFNRFAPYPESVATNTIFVYEKMPCFNCNWKCIFKIEKDETYPCIAISPVGPAWEAFRMLTSRKEQ